MVNPYHDADGKFASENRMRSAINILADSGELDKALTLQSQLDEANSKKTSGGWLSAPTPRKLSERIDNLSYLTSEQKEFFSKKLTSVNFLSSQYEHDYEADDVNSRPGEKEFLDNYDPHAYTDKDVSHSADNIIFVRGDDNRLKVLLIQRGGHPYKGSWAHPGGFIDDGESKADAAVRELEEETMIRMDTKFLQFVKSYDREDRDPRMNVVMNTHVALIPTLPPFHGSDDAVHAELVDVETIFRKDSTIPMAFDHRQSIRDAISFLISEKI
jgi:ADP-ribose pyrophosphatase YjhB (NUDIX family)